ncbi:hypothetical protein FHG87_000244, partial [Trinorchestia longiramus]
MPSTCCPINWALVVVILFVDALVDFSCAAVWSSGLTKQAVLSLMNDTELRTPGHEINFTANFHTLTVAASVLYSLTGISSLIAALGVLSGFYELQVHHFIVSLVRFIGTIVICESVLTIHYNSTIYTTTRILLYACSLLNVVLLFCNYASLAAEYERCVKEDRGELQPEERPLSHLFSRCLGSSHRRSRLTRRRPSSSEDALEADLDSVDGAALVAETQLKPRTHSGSVAVNIEEPVVEQEDDLTSSVKVSRSEENEEGADDEEGASTSQSSTQKDVEDSQSQKSQESQPEDYFKDEPEEPL